LRVYTDGSIKPRRRWILLQKRQDGTRRTSQFRQHDETASNAADTDRDVECHESRTTAAGNLIPSPYKLRHLPLDFALTLTITLDSWWCNVRALNYRLERSRIPGRAIPLSCNNLGQAVHTYVPLTPSSIMRYRSTGGDALWLER